MSERLPRAAMFKALGDPTRLRIFEFLCSCCCPVTVEETGEARTVDGPTAGEVCCRVTGSEQITSTVSFHLKELRLAGLITMERRGKTMICSKRCWADDRHRYNPARPSFRARHLYGPDPPVPSETDPERR